MNFSQALEEIKAGKQVCRKGWGVRVPVYLVNRRDHQDIEARNASGGRSFVAAPVDLLADDWEIIE